MSGYGSILTHPKIEITDILILPIKGFKFFLKKKVILISQCRIKIPPTRKKVISCYLKILKFTKIRIRGFVKMKT